MRSYALTALGTAAAVILAACGSGGDETAAQPATSRDQPAGTVTASVAGMDVTLEIPGGALPEGVTVDDIVIKTLEVDDSAPLDADTKVVASLELLPDGIKLGKPAVLTINVPGEASGSFFGVLISSDGTAEVLDPSAFLFPSSGEYVGVRLSVPHFSVIELIGVKAARAEASFVPEKDEDGYGLGETFTVQAVIDNFRFRAVLSTRVASGDVLFGWAPGVIGLPATFLSAAEAPWSVSFTWRAYDTGPAVDDTGLVALLLTAPFGVESDGDEPSPVEPKVKEGAASAAEGLTTLSVQQTFQCVRPGNFVINFNGAVRRTGTAVGTGETSTREFVATVFAQVRGQCIASAPPQATAVAPPTPEATAISLPQPPGNESGAGSTTNVEVEGNDVIMTASIPNKVTAGQSYQVQVSIEGPDGQPLSGTVSCSLFKRGDSNGTHLENVRLSSNGTSTLTLDVPWNRGDEVELFCSFEDLSEEAQLITSFFLR